MFLKARRIGSDGERGLRAEMPLQIADPQHQFGDGGGARVLFQSEELVRIDRMAREFGQCFLSAEIGQGLEHLAFEALHQFERYIEEIAGAAGRVQHARGAELVAKISHRFDRVLAAPLRLLPFRGREHARPIRAQRLDDCRDDKALNISARRIMRAETFALVRVERLLQQRAEDRGLHVAPIGRGGGAQLADLLLFQRQDAALLEKVAVEAQNWYPDRERRRRRESIACPQLPDQAGGTCRGRPRIHQQVAERPLGSSPTLCANMVKRQRMRNIATASPDGAPCSSDSTRRARRRRSRG